MGLRAQLRVGTKRWTPAIAAAILASAAPASHASHTCNTSDWTWPFCHVGRPSVPRFNMGGPRPPLTPKNSIWCTEGFINVNGSVGWYLIHRTKHDIRFWPDYYQRTFVGIYWNGRAWLQSAQPVYVNVDCDA